MRWWLTLLALGLGSLAGAQEDPLMRAHAAWLTGRPELRDGVAHGVWLRDRSRRFTLRSGCAEGLAARGVRARPLGFSPTVAPEPVVLEEPVGGVRFVKRHAHRPFVIACGLAERLPALAEVFRAHGVHTVVVSSALRREPRVSFHHLGLALDIIEVHGERAGARFALAVGRDYVGSPSAPTCRALDARADPLRSLLCDLHARAGASTAIGPDYGRGHEGHFHIDFRPADERAYVR